MLSHSQRVGHDGESRVHRTAGAEKAAIDDVEIVHVVSFAVRVQRAGSRIVAEAHRADLMRDTRERDSLPDIEIPREQSLVAFTPVNLACALLLHQFFKFHDQPLVSFLVVWRIAQDDSPFGIYRYAVVGVGQILRREPEVERVPRHHVEGPARRERRGAAFEGLAIELADERNMPQRIIPAGGAKVKIVHGERFLENGRIGAFR